MFVFVVLPYLNKYPPAPRRLGSRCRTPAKWQRLTTHDAAQTKHSVLRNMRAFDSAQPKVGRRRKVARARRWSELCEATISEMFELPTRPGVVPGVLRLRTLLLRAPLLLPLPLLRGSELGVGVGVR